tara:strand:- start:1811 stop:2185 length:375 start_codon:yes stop_codon:yes gene_type:complete
MDLQRQAEEFRHAFEVDNVCEQRDMQFTLVEEEFNEFRNAHVQMFDSFDNEASALKELADLVYVCYQYAENMEWDLNEAMDRVHQSNLSKLDNEGKPIRREDGKVLKGPNYAPPYLNDLCHLIC